MTPAGESPLPATVWHFKEDFGGVLQLPRTTGGLHISPSTGGQKSSRRWAAVSAAIPAGDRLRLTTERDERRPGTWDGRARWQPLCWNRPLRGLPLLLAPCWLAAGWGLALLWRHLQQPGGCSQTQQRPGDGSVDGSGHGHLASSSPRNARLSPTTCSEHLLASPALSSLPKFKLYPSGLLGRVFPKLPRKAK